MFPYFSAKYLWNTIYRNNTQTVRYLTCININRRSYLTFDLFGKHIQLLMSFYFVDIDTSISWSFIIKSLSLQKPKATPCSIINVILFAVSISPTLHSKDQAFSLASLESNFAGVNNRFGGTIIDSLGTSNN